MICESCGMPMDDPSDFGGGKTDNKYCIHCCDEAGTLKSREEVRSGMIQFLMSPDGEEQFGEKVESQEEASVIVDEIMDTMPAWGAKSEPDQPPAEAPPAPPVQEPAQEQPPADQPPQEGQ